MRFSTAANITNSFSTSFCPSSSRPAGHILASPLSYYSVFFCFSRRKKQFLPLKAAFILLTAMLLLPAAGSFMNGFSYTANRWGFGYSFLAALILVYLWPELFRLTLKEKGRLLLLTFLYLILLLNFQKAGSSDAFAGLVVLLLTFPF